MTDRHSGYVVTLDADIREDDAASIVSAISHIKHVASVKPVVAGWSIEAERARIQWATALIDLARNGPVEQE